MIEVNNVSKYYGNIHALDDISFNIKKGEIIGFLGPNGAGKTTMINIMTGYLSSTAGTVSIGGHDIIDETCLAQGYIGYLPDNPPLYNDMTVQEYLSFVYDFKKVKSASKKKTIEDIMKKVKVIDMRKRLIKNLSKGYRQRVGLGGAIIGDPEILILDEPSSGLDPMQIIEMRELIKSFRKEKTIILSSHILSEISEICDRVIIISNGKKVIEGNTSELAAKLGHTGSIRIRTRGKAQGLKEELHKLEGVIKVTVAESPEKGTSELIIDLKEGTDLRGSISKAVMKSGNDLLYMASADKTLEEMFIEATNQKTGKKL